jgi:nicotinate-nucleotide--dimethylbenzimidazole phosphoribosyltransferase
MKKRATDYTNYTDAISAPSPEWRDRAAARQNELVKPRGSLGKLETLSIQIAAIQETDRPTASPSAVTVFCADHGVCAEGVNAYPADITWMHTFNFLNGGAAVNALAAVAGAELTVVDVGIAKDFENAPGLIGRKVRPGTRNFANEPAMTSEEVQKALSVGVEIVEMLVEKGVRVIAIGEMGIGNTTSAAAITAVLTGADVAAVTGAGSGLDDAGILKKAAVIARALEKHQPNPSDPFDILEKVGGLEIAAMCGAFLACAAKRVVAVADGYISSVAAALAVRFAPAAKEYIVFAHLSGEGGHRVLCESFGFEPLLDLGMRLGETSGAALALPLLSAACETLSGMKTFSEMAAGAVSS